MDLVKSKQRVADHGEVFTPTWLVDEMLDLVGNESDRIDSRFLEPACGSGNFLVKVLERKLTTVQARFGKSEFEKIHHGLLSLMCIYGIELLKDNADECRQNLLEVFRTALDIPTNSEAYMAAQFVLAANIVQGDAIEMKRPDGEPIEFPEWAYLTKGKFSRRDFRFDSLTLRSSYTGTLFDLMADHEIFIPSREYPMLTVDDLAKAQREDSLKRVEVGK